MHKKSIVIDKIGIDLLKEVKLMLIAESGNPKITDKAAVTKSLQMCKAQLIHYGGTKWTKKRK